MRFLHTLGSLIVSSRQEVVSLLWQHMYLSVAAVLFAVVIGVPGGIVMAKVRFLGRPIISLAGILYNIPSLALFGFLVHFYGIGTATAMIALCIYALLPILRNTYTGLTEIEPALIEAARGMGVSDLQLLWRIEMPLAFPVIMAGVRQVVVMTIGITAIAAFVGAGGLGVLVFEGRAMMDNAMIVYSTLLIAVLAVIADRLLGSLEKKIRNRVGV